MVERWIKGSKNVAMVDEIAYPNCDAFSFSSLFIGMSLAIEDLGAYGIGSTIAFSSLFIGMSLAIGLIWR